MTKGRSLWLWILLERWPWRLGILGLSVSGVILSLLAPLPQKVLIDRLLGAPLSPEILSIPLISWISALSETRLILITVLTFLLGQLLGLLAGWIGVRESIEIQKQLSQALYTKALLQRAHHTRGVSVGQQVAVFATDVPGAGALLDQTLPLGAGVALPLILAPLLISSISPIPVWVAFAVIALVLIVDLLLARRQARFFARFKTLAAERVGLVNEWVQNIRLLRILGWVNLFELRIRRVREVETDNRVRMVTNGQFMGSIGNSVSFVLNIAAVLFLISVSPGDLSPGTLFAVLWIFGILLAKPFRQVPWVLTMTFDGLTSIKRIEAALNRPQIASTDPREVPVRVSSGEVAEHLAISVRGLKLIGEGGEQVLSDINVDIELGEWVALVGDVGAGKSQLLLSLLGETPASCSRFCFLGRNIETEEDRRWLLSQVSYVGQDGFVLSGSIRENLSLRYDDGREEDDFKAQALRRSQFELVSEGMSSGLETMIGERGVNLSGGQRQRVGLARADVFDRPVVFLDDALSAVDIKTENRLVQELFDGAWRHKTRLLVTHRMSVLAKVDRIIFLRHGKIAATGPLAELQKRRDFQEFMEVEGQQVRAQ